MKKQLLLLLSIFVIQFSFAQESFVFKGKIVSQSSSLQNINVQNKSRNTGTFSDEYGNFKLNATLNDTLFITAIFIKPVTYIVLEKDVVKETIYIPVENNVNNLDELALTEYRSITAEKLRIIPYGIKKKTYSERRLSQASGKDNLYGLNTQVSLDAIINAITGKTKRLKKELEIERKEFLREDIMLDYNKKFVVERLTIPEEYVNGFYYYLIEQPDFVAIYKAKDASKTEYAIIEKAQLFLKLISKEKQ